MTRIGVEGNPIEYGLIFFVPKIYVIKLYCALDLLIGHTSVRLVRMPPKPVSATRLLCKRTVCVADSADKGHIAVVCFRLLVNQVKDSLRTGKCGQNRIKLLGNLCDRLGKASGQL